jgi:glycosyltransferase involved in cell wall biosynthesis
MQISSKESPYFSIIIPSYNRAKFLLDTIAGVLCQDFTHFELIVIDDGSVDDTKEIVLSMQSTDSRLHYFYQQNSERAIARNRGAELAKGKFLIFLDSDDRFATSNYLQTLYTFIQKEHEVTGLYFCGAYIDYGDRKEMTKSIPTSSFTNFDFFLNEAVIPARVCLSKEIMKHYQFDPDCIVVEDTVLWTAVMKDYPIKYIPYYGVTYQIHEGNSVNISKQNAYLLRLRGLKKLFRYYEVGKQIPDVTKKSQINRCYLGIALYYFHRELTLHYILWVLISIVRYPNLDTKHKFKLLFLFKRVVNK